MRILLVGEYSRFHNSLKEGLQKLQHDVTLIGRADNFKNYPIDVSLEATFFHKKIPNAFRQLFFKIFKIDIAFLEITYRFYKHRKSFRNYDVVQLINEFPFATTPFVERKLLKYLFKHNKKVFLSSCGDDFHYVNFILNADLPYHMLTAYQKDKSTKKWFQYSLQYLSKSHEKLHHFVMKNINGIIPANFDYEMAYRNHPKVLPLIPFPINIDVLKFQPLEYNGKVIIFHGVNKVNYLKKGNNLIEKALQLVAKKYPNQVEIKTAENLPYSEYIQTYNEAHIIMDQLYGYDQGYNALEAMSKGKVVFSGAEKDFLAYYQIEQPVLMNATPNVDDLVEKLSELIENPEEMMAIGKRARAFVEEFHQYETVAQQYVSLWNES
ncbi:glycosyltransferase involved in cell wall biosynthesis [Kordia periserrulae]|uniref:Glycosyltransferase involved in cell wall biosynthesis n=1 Tax=Kordia periserrulae TaxID=701523 RepID=A0A2T6BYL0_9FLAO|nr:glycosyltransferase [Kordia periserrulae]PTX61155.1 glycosyltransferase involved in cell wall biosynthesis [Kordia periserrulae]